MRCRRLHSCNQDSNVRYTPVDVASVDVVRELITVDHRKLDTRVIIRKDVFVPAFVNAGMQTSLSTWSVNSSSSWEGHGEVMARAHCHRKREHAGF